MRLKYLGHSCFLVETARARLLIDPFLRDNPRAPAGEANIACDYIVISHGHDDHTADALPVAQRCGATIIANFEIAEYFSARGAKTHGLNPGGSCEFPFGRVKLTLAHHSSSLGDPLNPIYLGAPCGILISADGKNLYHAGDTAVFLDMQLIGRAGLDAALLPIGDNFTMGPDDALLALDFLRPRVTVPMHYDTWPVIAQDAAAFATRAAQAGHRVEILAPGASFMI
ncbi:MAG: metal-dependent hydrolase [Opitutaceae bacterium]|nr:metal-dependent hydrolase [Opitutaceae bacterium]